MSTTEAAAPAEAHRTGDVVSATDLTKVYGEGESEVRALDGVTISFPHGQLAAVMGPSGSGKSTLMHILAGLDQPTSGSVIVDGTELAGLNDQKLTLLRREKIGFVFQFFNLLPMLTAQENIELPLRIAGASPDPDWQRTLITDPQTSGGLLVAYFGVLGLPRRPARADVVVERTPHAA